MSERLLTEEEIVKEASKDSTYCQLSVDIGLWASKAQDAKTLKVVGEWLRFRFPDYGWIKTLLRGEMPKEDY